MHDKDLDENKRKDDSLTSPKPDPETLHTPDPQEKMKGPVSSPMHDIGGAFDTSESKKEAEEKREKHY